MESEERRLMAGWQLRPRAQADLDDIADYTFLHWDLEQTDRYILGLEKAFSQLLSKIAGAGEAPPKNTATCFGTISDRISSSSNEVMKASI